MDSSSFSDMLRRQAPHLLPAGGGSASEGIPGPSNALPHGTTIVALKFPGGVLIAGDRRSTQGNIIAGRDVQKVYVTDDYTATGIAGTAAIAVEFARLYAVELEHYEKLGRNAAHYALGEMPEPVVVPTRGEAMGARYHARVALLYAIETSFVVDGASPEEIEVSYTGAPKWASAR